MSDLTGGRNIAEYDWCATYLTDCTGKCESCTCIAVDGVVENCNCDDRCDCVDHVLHAPSDPSAWDDWDDWDGGLVLGPSLCGVGICQSIPGVFDRMGADRCGDCCDLLGLPHGVGSPKNDDSCRRLLGMPPSARLSSPQTNQRPFPGVPGPVGDESTRRTP